MKHYLLSFALLALVIAVVAITLEHQKRELHAFCDELTIGRSLVQVRKDADREGFDAKVEAYAQLRIEPPLWQWNPSPPSCRVFFGKARTIEYRIWEGI